jgi:hypothetical protein
MNRREMLRAVVAAVVTPAVAVAAKVSSVRGVPSYPLPVVSEGAAEMYWRGCSPGLVFEVPPGKLPLDNSEIAQQIWEYNVGLKRYLELEGMTCKPINFI